jgi:hypothetical protein
MMPNFAGVEKFFAHMTFKASGAAGHSCRKQFSTRQILNAKLPEPGGGSTVEAEGIPRNDLDATTGDIQLNLDWRAFLPARLRREQSSMNPIMADANSIAESQQKPSDDRSITRHANRSCRSLDTVPIVHIEPWCWP